MPQKRKKDIDILEPLPDKNNPGYFRALVNNCIKAYEESSNDGLALDFCKVADKKLRAMILNDEVYKVETKNIYARQRIEEMKEVEYLASLAANDGMDGDDEDDDHYAPRDGERTPKKITGADKDMINMRFKAAQMKRDLRAEMYKKESDSERDMVYMMTVSVTREEMENLVLADINEGSDNGDIDELIGTKDEVPVGTVSKPKAEVGDGYFDILPNGEIVER